MSQGRFLMTMRARVTRPQAAQRDDYGTPVADSTPDVTYDALPCRAWAPTDVREVFDSGQVVAGAVRMSVPLDTVIQQNDIVRDIRDRRGNVLFDGPLKVTSVIRLGRDRAVMLRSQIGGS